MFAAPGRAGEQLRLGAATDGSYHLAQFCATHKIQTA
jgi:hypothetical protein